MEFNDFVKNFHEVFDETDIELLTPETRFKDLAEWSSLHALATMTMIENVYGKMMSIEEMKTMITVNDLYNFARS